MTSASSKPGNAKSKQKGRTVRKGKKAHNVEKRTSRKYVSSFTTTTDAYADELYRDAIEDSDVDAYLEETDCYDCTHKTWSVPDPAAIAEDLPGYMFNIISSILRRFVKPTQSSVEREVVNTHNIPACHKKSKDGYRAYPTFIVQASGPSFELPEPLDPFSATDPPLPGLGFTNMASYISVRLDAELGSVKKNINEMASYASGIFRDQPNRFHVRCLVLTQRHARLIHFDRAGAQVTPLVSIHENPHTFVRLVAGLSSKHERVVGLDDSIQWTIVEGRKQQGTLTTMGPTGEAKTYPIVERIPVPQETICGRVTTCWRVKDPDTLEEYVVKDSWRPNNSPAEHELLELVKGIPGVVQMVSYEIGRPQTKEFRCPSTTGGYRNRVATRVTTRSYGKTIESFTSILQVVRAIRDAMAGHQRIAGDDIRIIHRDVSQHNILLGRENAPEGDRGILIDLDRAFKATDEKPDTLADHNIGTRIFQSLSVLKTAVLPKSAPAHDYLDDLESFFYLLAYIFLLYRPDGSRVPSAEEGPSIIYGWGEELPADAHAKKVTMFGAGRIGYRCIKLIKATWGLACGTLFANFRNWIYKMWDKKAYIIRMQARGKESGSLASLLAKRDEHYSTVLKMFDDAIQEIETFQRTKSESAPSLSSDEMVVPAEKVEPSADRATLQATPASSGTSQPILDPSTSAEDSAPTPPPATVAQASTPQKRKRGSDDGEHPELPDTKAGWGSEGEHATARSP